MITGRLVHIRTTLLLRSNRACENLNKEYRPGTTGIQFINQGNIKEKD